MQLIIWSVLMWAGFRLKCCCTNTSIPFQYHVLKIKCLLCTGSNFFQMQELVDCTLVEWESVDCLPLFNNPFKLEFLRPPLSPYSTFYGLILSTFTFLPLSSYWSSFSANQPTNWQLPISLVHFLMLVFTHGISWKPQNWVTADTFTWQKSIYRSVFLRIFPYVHISGLPWKRHPPSHWDQSFFPFFCKVEYFIYLFIDNTFLLDSLLVQELKLLKLHLVQFVPCPHPMIRLPPHMTLHQVRDDGCIIFMPRMNTFCWCNVYTGWLNSWRCCHSVMWL